MTIANAVNQCSPNAIRNALINLKTNAFCNKKLLDINIYQDDVIETIKREHSDEPSEPDDLAEYIAISSILHCLDGWKLFSCAIDNLLNRDIPNTVFLAYYAQLRALMSFFATEGIGVFDTKHFYFDKSGNCDSFEGKTHETVKELISEWANNSSKSYRLLQLLKYEGKDYFEWISSADVLLGTPSSPEISRDWLLAWSVDLPILGEDHKIRNNASYRPQGIKDQKFRNQDKKFLKFCIDTWNLSEPYASNHFSSLDQILLHETMLAAYKKRYPPKRNFQDFVTASIENLGLSIDQNQLNMLSKNGNIDNVILKSAKENAYDSERNINPIPVLCRGFLLLRIASAAVENLIKSSGISKSDLSFWWKNYGNNYGLWESNEPPMEFEDLWLDISEALENLESGASYKTGNINLRNLRQTQAYDLWQIRQFAKAGFWAIGL